jgi:RNA polymerase sigma-70 factor (ECF subfamily)
MDAAQASERSVIPADRTGAVAWGADWEALYGEHFRGVWRNLRRLGVPSDLLDDAVQDVFLVVHRRLAEFGGRSSLKTWIFGIVVRVAKDYLRATRRRAARAERYAEAMSGPSEGSSPADEAARREEIELLQSILASLGAEERAVFVLVELEQLSVREAAEATSLSLTTCERRLRSARQRFDRAVQHHPHRSQRRPTP